MAVVTNIANLSQTASLNGPDGAVDPPSVLDDQDRYHGSFIAMLRDGVGFTPGALVASLGFTPVRQGTGPGQGANTTSIGWSASLGRLLCSVDGNGFNNYWPIDNDGTARGLRSGGAQGGAEIRLAWTDPGDIPTYLFGGMSPTDGRVVPPSRLTVNRSTTSGRADSAARADSAGYADNAGAVNGISGWNYSNRNYNPPYLWATAGSGGDQFLVQPGNLTVNRASSAGYADSAGSAPANGGTSTNSNQLLGRGDDYWINNSNSALRTIRNNGAIQCIAWTAGVGDMWWGTNLSDERLKKDIAPTAVDSLAQIMRLRFVRYRFREDKGFQIDTIPGREWPIGVIAQEAEKIESTWINNDGTWKQPDTYAMLMSAMHAIQQLTQKVTQLAQQIERLA